jgi:hypothetical protein
MIIDHELVYYTYLLYVMRVVQSVTSKNHIYSQLALRLKTRAVRKDTEGRVGAHVHA